MKNEVVKVNNQEVSVIEWNNERVITTAQLAEVYGASEQQVQQNFNNHHENFLEGKHYIVLKGEELKSFKRYFDNIEEAIGVSKFAPQLYLWTKRGASRHCKILDTEKAWEQFDFLEEAYFNPQRSMQTDELSPELQMFSKIFESAARLELKQKEQDKKLEQLDSKVDSIKDVVALRPNAWRKETGAIINKIAFALGGTEHIKAVREQSYKTLEERMHVALNIRLANKKKTNALNGMCKSKLDKLNQLDVIADDPKLIEGYIAIIKEMAIKYGISTGEVA